MGPILLLKKGVNETKPTYFLTGFFSLVLVVAFDFFTAFLVGVTFLVSFLALSFVAFFASIAAFEANVASNSFT